SKPLPYRTIQIGLSGEAVRRFVSDWIVTISDVTELSGFIHDIVQSGDLERAARYLPRERPYAVGMSRGRYLANERERLLDTSHEEHEDILGLLQAYPDNESVRYVRQAILLKPTLAYLRYDDYGAFYKKCLWVLQDIGTADALMLIRECAAHGDAVLRTQAEYRLQRIAEGGRDWTQFPKKA